MTEAAKPVQRTTLQGVQVVRGVAAILVVLYHVAGKLAQDYQADLPGLTATTKFGFAGVDLFFVLSGFIIVWITWPEIGRPSKAPGFLLRRFFRVVPIFWILWLASAAVYLSVGMGFYQCKPDVSIFEENVKSLFLIDPAAHCMIPQAWTLTWELMFYLVFAVFLCLPRALLPFLLAAWAGLIAGAITFGFDTTMPLQAFCLHFILGCFAGLLTRVWPMPMPLVPTIAGIVLWGVAIWMQFNNLAAENSPLTRFVVFGIPSAILLYGVASADVRSNPRYPAPLNLVGDASYVLYLVHMTIIFYMQSTFPRVDSVWGPWIWAGGAIASSIAIACLVHVFIERPMLKLLNSPKNIAVSLTVIAVVVAALLGLAWYLQMSFTRAPLAPAAPPVVVPETAPPSEPLPPLESIELVNGVQGWANIQVKNTIYEIPGWAVDREKNQTVRRIVVFLDGVVFAEQEPTTPRPDVPVGKTIGNRQSGFLFNLDAAKVDAAKCVRFLAVLEDGRFGHIGFQIRGQGYDTQVCWNPSELPA